MPNSRVEPVILVRIGVDIDEVAAARLVKIFGSWFERLGNFAILLQRALGYITWKPLRSPPFPPSGVPFWTERRDCALGSSVG